MKACLTIFCVIFLSCSESTTAQKSDVSFIGVKSQYQSKDRFDFSIKNNNDNVAYYYFISLEAYFNGSWHEALMDIDPKAPEKASIIKKIEPLGRTEVRQDSLNFFAAPIDPRVTSRDKLKVERYRFVLNYNSKTNDENFKKSYSQEFTVE